MSTDEHNEPTGDVDEASSGSDTDAVRAAQLAAMIASRSSVDAAELLSDAAWSDGSGPPD